MNINQNKLSAEVIKQLLGETKFDVHVENTVTSTNTVLKELAKKGEKTGYVLIAEEQTNGKGRLGRSFYSPSETGIYMSVILRPEITAENSLFITAAAAVAVSRAVEKVSNGAVTPGIKWVNDIFVNNKKVCGILTEASINGANGKLNFAVLGIGVNIYPPENDFPQDIKNIAAPVFSANQDKNLRNKLAAEILRELKNLPENFMSDRILSEYRNRSMLVGKKVCAICGDNKQPCTVLDIDNKARLVVRFENGVIKALSSGEVSIRL